MLIFKRKLWQHCGGLWEFPGGKIEEGETPQEALKREIEEELNVKIEVGEFVGTCTHDYGTVSNQSKHIKLSGYFVKLISGIIKLTDHDEYRWVDPEKFDKSIMAPADIPLVDKIIEKRGKS